MQILTNDIVNDGLVLYLDAGIKGSYPGSGTTWADLTKNYNGTLQNGAAFSSLKDGSIFFDGNDDQVLVGATDLSPETITVEVWFKLNSTSVDRFLISKSTSTSAGQREWEVYVASGGGSAGFVLGNPSAFTWVTGALNNPVANWHQVVGTRGGGVGKFYVNGTIANEVSYGFTPVSGTRTVYIGRDISGFGRWMNGNIAIVKVYNRALSATEVSQNFEATRNRFGI